MDNKETTSVQPRKKECVTCIPVDIIEQILLRLPVSCLLRCLSVCKQWFNIIRDPQFIEAHLQCAPRCTLLFLPKESVSSKLYPSDAVLFDETWSPSTWAVPVIEPDDLLCASCNGLLCFYTKTSTIKIANLATGECLHLAKPGKNLRGDHFTLYNLGYHPKAKEYKVIHFLRQKRCCAEGSYDVIRVYTLGDEKWRDVRAPSSIWVEFLGVVNVDGAMYWLVEDGGTSQGYAVMSFDLKEEIFVPMQPPLANLDETEPPSAIVGPHWYRITEIDGKVCVASARIHNIPVYGPVGRLHVWTLESKAEQRWSQKFNIELSSFYIPGPHFVYRDKILVQGRDNSIYCHEFPGTSFEIESTKMVKLVNFTPRRANNLHCYAYVKSLVRLDLYKRAGVVRRPKRREWWELKRWEAWGHELREVEELWANTNRMERTIEALASRIDVDVIQLLQHSPDQQPRSLRWRTWVERERDKDELKTRLDRINDMMQETGINPSTLKRLFPDQSTSGWTASISGHQGGDGDDELQLQGGLS